ncbi:MAG: multidrug export protein EmrA, partial [Edwardsiella piscicida]
MSENLATQATQQPAHNKKKQRKTWMLGMTGVFILIAAAYLVYWFIVLRHHQETDDAYVTGNLVQINAQVSGSVTRVNF